MCVCVRVRVCVCVCVCLCVCVYAFIVADDFVWVHDYHLMLMPAFLRSQQPRMKIGWFLHTPFPSSEIYRALPYREEVLHGILAADLLGFHIYDYARHFKSACTKILGIEVTHQVIDCGRCVIDVYTCLCLYGYVHACMYVCAYVCVCACMYVCVCVFPLGQST